MSKRSQQRKIYKQHRPVEKCKRKTSTGCVYNTLQEAKAAALASERNSVKRIEAFFCVVCEKYHIGGRGMKESLRGKFPDWINL